MATGERLRGHLLEGRDRARRATLAALARSVPGPEALDGKLRPALLAAMTQVAASPGDPSYLFSTQDREIGWSTYRHSGFDDERTKWVIDRLGDHVRGRTVLDIGANIGTVAIPLVKIYGAARAVAFEPDPLNYKLLRCNTILNEVEAAVVCMPVAISDASGSVEFELSDTNYGDHRVRVGEVEHAAADYEPPRPTITVRAQRLPEALDDAGVRGDQVGLVWGDTQGHEGHVMAGAGDLLRSGPWVLEYWPFGLRRSGGAELFHTKVSDAFSTVTDIKASIREGREVTYPAEDVTRVAASLGERGHTDLLLLP